MNLTNAKVYSNRKKGWHYIGLLNDSEVEFCKHLLSSNSIILPIKDFCYFLDGKGIVNKPIVLAFHAMAYENEEDAMLGGYGRYGRFHHLEYLIHRNRKEESDET